MKRINTYIIEKLSFKKGMTAMDHDFLILIYNGAMQKYCDKKYGKICRFYCGFFILDKVELVDVWSEFNDYPEAKFNNELSGLYKFPDDIDKDDFVDIVKKNSGWMEQIKKEVNIEKIENPYKFIKDFATDISIKKSKYKVDIDDVDIPKQFVDAKYPAEKHVKDSKGNDRVWFKLWKILAYNGPMPKRELMRWGNPTAREGSNATMFGSLNSQNIITYNTKTKNLEAQPVSKWNV